MPLSSWLGPEPTFYTGATPMSDDTKQLTQQTNDLIQQLAEAAMTDTMGLHMQNAVTNQQGTQTISTAITSTACALILKQG
ncbi:RebB family R body protein [Celerinatantimonas sp. YJH-8]|uniref:RebB family R body protein n=1 Tax=Celerinatantimonas sp. YJH-8 TaxID=3228714 RepID=UPI0038C70D12